MKNIILNSFSIIASTLILILSSPHAQAEKILVKKIKGRQAIIETSLPLEENQTYELLTDSSISQDVDYKKNVHKSRANSLTLGAQLEFLRSSTYQRNKYDLQIRYGWNFSSLELGVLINILSEDVGGGATTTILGGGYFDYNLVANADPKNLIYGIFTLLSYGSTSYPSSLTGGSTTTLQANGGGFITYFIRNTSAALRAEVFGIYQQVSTSLTQTNLTGLGARGLLVFYF